VPGRLLTVLSPAEAVRLANVERPGLRLPPPEGGVLRECLRRHGLIGTWSELPALVPELAPAAAVAATKDAEQELRETPKAELPSATYRVPGRRGRAGTVLWDPARVRDPAAELSHLLGVTVTVDRPEPPTWAPDPAFAGLPRSVQVGVLRPSALWPARVEWPLGPPAAAAPPGRSRWGGCRQSLLATCTCCGEPVEPATPLCGHCMWARAAASLPEWLVA
jgi:hypothetical protein